MKITGRGSINPIQVYNNNRKSQTKGEKTAQQADTVELSLGAQQVAKFTRLAEELPEVREALIAEIKAQMKEQAYQVSPEQLATSLIAFMNGEK